MDAHKAIRQTITARAEAAGHKLTAFVEDGFELRASCQTCGIDYEIAADGTDISSDHAYAKCSGVSADEYFTALSETIASMSAVDILSLPGAYTVFAHALDKKAIKRAKMKVDIPRPEGDQGQWEALLREVATTVMPLWEEDGKFYGIAPVKQPDGNTRFVVSTGKGAEVKQLRVLTTFEGTGIMEKILTDRLFARGWEVRRTVFDDDRDEYYWTISNVNCKPGYLCMAGGVLLKGGTRLQALTAGIYTLGTAVAKKTETETEA